MGTTTTAPYTFTWTNVQAGKYTLTAVATDNRGVKTTSHEVHIIVDILPTVSLTSPVNGASFKAPATIPLTASAKDPDGKITKVDFYQGTSLIATVTSKPYTFTLNNVQGGNYSFTAVATDNRGEATTSSPVTITVVPDIPPTISLTTNGATFKAPASVTLTAQANDRDGTVTKVDFFQGNTPIATITPPAPFIFTVNNLAQGSYTFTAIATDDQGATTTSNQATITVTPATAQVYYIYTDQLNTPRAITDQTNKVVWRWDNQDPFGANVPDEDPDGDGIKFTCNLRFAGQYFDRETGTHYNYYRDYDPNIGRYVQSDLIGLEGGINTYAYVNGNPLRWGDQRGLDNILLGGGGSLVYGGGGEGSAGIYISNKPFDIGIFSTGGVGPGYNVGLAGYLGYTVGPKSALENPSININVSSVFASGTLTRDVKTGKFVGVSIGPAAKLGVSMTYTRTSTWGLRDLFDKLFERLFSTPNACL